MERTKIWHRYYSSKQLQNHYGNQPKTFSTLFDSKKLNWKIQNLKYPSCYVLLQKQLWQHFAEFCTIRWWSFVIYLFVFSSLVTLSIVRTKKLYCRLNNHPNNKYNIKYKYRHKIIWSGAGKRTFSNNGGKLAEDH